MSEQPQASNVPRFDLADRMRKALREAGMDGKEMADYLEVAQGTVSTWINGRFKPSKQTIRLWAMRTGVSYDWLCHGDHDPCDMEPGQPVSAGQARIITGRYRTRRPFTATPAVSFPYLPAAA